LLGFSVKIHELHHRDPGQLPSHRRFDHFAVHGEDPGVWSV
jgi:hypothetical protein